jgi:rod shape-determining protein MreD
MGLAAGLAVLLETTVLQALPFGRPAPDLLLILCVYLGLHRHTAGGVVGAFLLGYLQDSVSGSAAGLNSFGMVLVFVLVYLTCRRLWVDNVVSKVVLVFLASLVKTVAIVVLMATFLGFEESWNTLGWDLVINGALTAVLAPAVFAVLSSARLPDEREA